MPAFRTKAAGEFPQMLHALENQSRVQETRKQPTIFNSVKTFLYFFDLTMIIILSSSPESGKNKLENGKG